MLSYQHAFHAGGPADVHKHAALALLIAHLAKKDKAFSIVDLYAGEGEYDLDRFAAQKTQEYKDGIAKLWAAKNRPASLTAYFDVLTHLNPEGELRRYPGSPAVARHFLRGNDRLVLNELHSTAFPELGRWARKDERIGVHKRDGMEALMGLVPPRPKRGLVLIDPSYEVKSEYTAVAEKLAQAAAKWREGIYVVWYPILKEARHRALVESATAGVEGDVLLSEIYLAPRTRGEQTSGLLGTGLIVVNPPWQFDIAMKEAGAWIARHLGGAKHFCKWLKRVES